MIITAVTQLAIIVLWLLKPEGNPIEALGKWSLYGQWLVLLTCAALCLLRRKIASLSFVAGVFSVLGIGLIVLVLLELVAMGWSSGFSQVSLDFDRLLRFGLADVLILGALLRFFSFLTTMENRNKAESQSRIEALQSRIQPHFLFNSLNTISELTATQPEQAEQAINSLSMLFRASLENNRKSHSLKNELSLCKRYIELERWRVGERLTLKWDLHVEDAAKWSIPKLIVQPLIENAIVHGVQNDGSINIRVDVRETDKHLSIKIENSVGQQTHHSPGHGIALENIKERLFVLFDDQQTFRVKQDDNLYSVIMRFPKLKFVAEALAS
ncbi:MAG: two-component system sensor histidine kinase AlgZ [Cryomorphaceae bacterium]